MAPPGRAVSYAVSNASVHPWTVADRRIGKSPGQRALTHNHERRETAGMRLTRKMSGVRVPLRPPVHGGCRFLRIVALRPGGETRADPSRPAQTRPGEPSDRVIVGPPTRPRGGTMETNPVIELLGRRLRLAVIGGGPGSFIGAMHRTAARLDDRYELVAGVLSSDPERSRAAATSLGITPERAYADAETLFSGEMQREDGADVVAIMTPNDSHHRYALGALRCGFDVICDKPMTNTLTEAADVVAAVEDTRLVFCLTHNYTGYPMVRQARAMVENGLLGEIRLVQVEYVQGGKAAERDPDPDGPLPWRYDPVRGGPSLVMGDIGTHAHNLARFVTGLEVSAVAADIGHIVPNRLVDDYAGA